MSYRAYDPVTGQTKIVGSPSEARRWARSLGYDNMTHIEITRTGKGSPLGPAYCRICKGPHVYKHGKA